jgi:uncharacterized YigZ family protein
MNKTVHSDKDTYKTINEPTKGLYKDKGSKFLAFAYPVFSEEEIKIHITNLKKEYFDARHHCYAYVLGLKSETYRAFDDGEPSGTAGKPILGQIHSFELTNILIVVVRYFGGILLGTGGLINAYKLAAADSIQHAKITEKTENSKLSVGFSYEAMNDVMRILKDENIEQLKSQFDLDCKIDISVRNSKVEELVSKLKKINSVKIEMK